MNDEILSTINKEVLMSGIVEHAKKCEDCEKLLRAITVHCWYEQVQRIKGELNEK